MALALSYRQKEQLFHELTQLSRSAVPLLRSFEMLSRNPRSRIGQAARTIQRNLESQGVVGSSFASAGFPPSDAAVIEAGEAAGRLDAVFSELETYYRQLAEARQRIISRCLYPVLVLHLGVFLLSIPPTIIAGGGYLGRVIPALGAFYLTLVAVFAFWRILRYLLAHSTAAARTILSIPVLGGFLEDWTAWKFTSVLSLYVRAGGGFLKAFEISGATCENALYRRASAGAIASIQSGSSLTDAIIQESGWPETLGRALEIGEHSGRLDEEIQRAAGILMTRTLDKLKAFSVWAPRLIYICIVLLTGWMIINMIMGVYGQMGQVLKDAAP